MRSAQDGVARVTNKKRELAYLVTVLLVRGRAYKTAEIDQVIRDAIHARWLTDPRLAPDHIRLAMIEGGLVERDAGGDGYRLAAGFVAADDMIAIATRARELSYAASTWVSCPACKHVCVPISLPSHVEACHGTRRWLELADKFGS